MRYFEEKVNIKRPEYSKTSWFVLEERYKVILKLLSKNPEGTLQEIEAPLIENGLYGMVESQLIFNVFD